MTKKTILFAVMVLLVLSGCSKKKPKPNSANEIAQDTISVDESMGSGIGGSGISSGASSNGGNYSGYNSSSDGMRSLYFAFDEYSISSQMQGTISFNSNILRQKLGSSQVKLEGNCDEFGTDEYNYALGLKRAKSVKDSLVQQGIKESRIVLVSYGESNPMCSSMTDECYAQNRRVDLHILR
jgi:peptidoglycan-associated lipoprotein